MAVGTPLSVLRQMLNAEVGVDMNETASPASVPINNRLINNQQAFLCGQHSYLIGKTRVSFPLTPYVQFYPLNSLLNGSPINQLMDFDRPEATDFINYSNFRYRMSFGIGQEDYNIYNSTYGVAGVPVMKWDLVNAQVAINDPAASYPSTGAITLTYTGLTPGQTYIWIPGVEEVNLAYNGNNYAAQGSFTAVAGVTTATVTGAANSAAFTGELNTVTRCIEVWPIPSIPQTLELAGTLPITQLQNDSDTCVIDDMLIVLSLAAEITARSGYNDAGAKLAKAKAHMQTLQASYPSKFETFNLSGGQRYIPGFDRTHGRPVVAVSGPASQ